MDTQTTELLGRNRLMDELLLAGLEVALPARDRGVDLIAYVDLESKISKFVATPIQMKAASTRSFAIDRKYSKISNLVIVYVWGLQAPQHAETYALTYREALAIAKTMGWTITDSWTINGKYSTSRPSLKLCKLLLPYRMSSVKWWEKITSNIKDQIT